MGEEEFFATMSFESVERASVEAEHQAALEWQDHVNSFVLYDVIRQARTRSFEQCHGKGGYLKDSWSSYRLAAAVAFLLVTRWEDYVGKPPECRGYYRKLLGDHALPLSTRTQSNPYIRVCAMDAADTVIRMLEHDEIKIGEAPLTAIKPLADAFADTLAGIEGQSGEDLLSWIDILQPQLEEMGRKAKPPEPDPDPIPPDPDPPEPHRRSTKRWLLAATLIVVLVIAVAVAVDTQLRSKDPVANEAGHVTSPSSSAPSAAAGSPASAGPVVPNVLELVTARTTAGNQTAYAVPWGQDTGHLSLDLNANNTFSVEVTLSLETAQRTGQWVDLTPSVSAAVKFALDGNGSPIAVVTEPDRNTRQQVNPLSGEAIGVWLAGDRRPSTFTAELSVLEDTNVPPPGQEAGVLTCGTNWLMFEVLLSIDASKNRNVTVQIPLEVTKDC